MSHKLYYITYSDYVTVADDGVSCAVRGILMCNGNKNGSGPYLSVVCGRGVHSKDIGNL